MWTLFFWSFLLSPKVRFGLLEATKGSVFIFLVFLILRQHRGIEQAHILDIVATSDK